MVSLTFSPLSTSTLSGAGVTFVPVSVTSISLTSEASLAVGDRLVDGDTEADIVGSSTTGESALSPAEDPQAPRASTVSAAAAGTTNQRRARRGKEAPWS